MKSGWEIVPLEQLCSIKSGKSDTQDAVEDGAYAFFDRSRTIKKSSRYLYDCEALIIPGEGTEFFPKYFIGKFDLHQRAYALFGFSDRIDVKFLYYFLYHLCDYFPRVAVGATVKSLRRRHFEQLPVSLTGLPEQQRIVALLDDAFASIARARAHTEKNLKNARALFESHLQFVFTQRGEKWCRVPLSSVLSVQPRNGWSPPAEFQTGSGVPVLTLSAVTGFEYDGARVKMSSAPTREDAHYWLQNGELLITRSNTQELVGHVAIYDGNPAKAICCDLIMKMQVNPTQALTRFIYFYLRSPEARTYLTSRAQGASSTMKKIGKQVVQNIPVPKPSLADQQSIISTLDALYENTQHLESLYQRKLATLDELKKSLLHQAFSGAL